MFYLLLFGGVSAVSLAVDSLAVPVLLAWVGGIILSYVLIPFLWIGGRLKVNIFIVDAWSWLSGGSIQDGYIPSCNSATNHDQNAVWALVLSFIALVLIFVILIPGLIAIVTTFCAFFVPLIGAVATISAVIVARNEEGKMNRNVAFVAGTTLSISLGATALLLLPLIVTGLLMRVAHDITLASC